MRFLSLILVLCFSSVSLTANVAFADDTAVVDNKTDQTTILILGDSLSAGYQMSIEESWPSLLSKQLKQKGIEANVINGSISGDTSGNGLQRLPSLLDQHNPDLVIVELGANDGLRGFSPVTIKQNLNQIISLVKENGSDAALMQIMVPPNYGKRYSQAFTNLYPDVAKQQDIPLLPFFP